MSAEPPKTIPYKLTIESLPLGKQRLVVMITAFLVCVLGCIAWKKSLEKRGIQWKSNSSYYSSQGRISAAADAAGKGKITFLGSSITGRIHGAESGISQYYNIGIDASSANEGIHYILAGIVPHTEYIAIEMNTLLSNLPFVNKDISGSRQTEKLTDRLVVTNPLYRTSTLLYSELRHEKVNYTKQTTWPLLEKTPEPQDTPAYQPSEKVTQTAALLKQLKKQTDSKIILVIYPVQGRKTSPSSSRTARFLASSLAIPLLDLNERVPSSIPIQFSDNIHMKAEEAWKAANTIYSEAQKQWQKPPPVSPRN